MPTAEANASNLGLQGDYRPYPTYKPSGAEWLGKIPAHWTVRRLKSFTVVQLSNVDKKSTAGQKAVRLCNYTDVYYREHIGPDVEFMSATATKEQIRRFSLKAGDVLITKDSEDWSDIAVPAVVTQNLPSILCGYHLALIRPHTGCDGAFLSRALAAIGPGDQYQLSANGITRYGLTGDSIRASVLALPPLPEQRAIAAFLDRETAKIDALVEKKERLIELLQEKRTALISRAVTKGLDPNVPMKDSGVECLGEIPAHWDSKRLKYLLRGHLQYGANEPSKYSDPNSPRYIRITDIREDGTLWDDTFRSIPQEVAEPFLLAEGDLLFARSGATVGKTFRYRPSWGRAAYAGYLVRARLNDHISESDFVNYYTHSQNYKDWILGNLIQSTIQNVSAERYASLAVPLPPLVEQQAISKHLDSETAKLNALIATIREAIERLQELRSALISAAVTGRIDVRKEAA